MLGWCHTCFIAKCLIYSVCHILHKALLFFPFFPLCNINASVHGATRNDKLSFRIVSFSKLPYMMGKSPTVKKSYSVVAYINCLFILM